MSRVLLFTGKGGVGKTTAASATALRLAERGTKTLVVSTDSAHSLGDSLDVPLSGEPVEVAPALWAVQIDAQRRFETAWRDVQRYMLDTLASGGVDPITADELAVLPGIEEVLALLAVRDLAADGRWDAVVVDCAPTAETLRLLALPEALGWYLDRVFPAQRRLARTMRPVAALLGRSEALPPDGVFAALLQLAGELESVRGLLADHDTTSVRLVLTPEAVVAAEARRTYTALALYGYRVDMVIANRVFPAGPDEFRARWAAAQQQQLAGLSDAFAALAVRELEYLPAEPIGLDALREVGAALHPDGEDPAAVAAPPSAMRVDADGEEFVLRLPLPLAGPGSVDATRAGDDLIVTVDGRRRVLALPSALRRCEVMGGGLRGGELAVRFRPDPALWPDPAPRPAASRSAT